MVDVGSKWLKRVVNQNTQTPPIFFYKMADGVVCSQVHSRILVQNSGNIDEYVCIKCSVYETQLKEALDELGSARFINDILQKELITAVSTKNAQKVHNFIDTSNRYTPLTKLIDADDTIPVIINSACLSKKNYKLQQSAKVNFIQIR